MTMIPQLKRRRTATALVSIAIMASTLCLQSRFTSVPKLLLGRRGGGDDDLLQALSSLSEEEQQQMKELEEEKEDETQFRRNLMNMLRGAHFKEIYNEDYDGAVALADSSSSSGSEESTTLPPLQPYTLEDTLLESTMFECTFTIIVYDPPTDKFTALYSKDHRWRAGNRKLWKALKQVLYMLRKEFPHRFTPQMPEFAFAMGSGDYPHVKTDRLPHSDGVAPVMQFGSSFRDPTVYSNMIAMPMPESHHLDCFEEWAETQWATGDGSVCTNLKAKPEGALEFGDDNGLEWGDLIPQVIWRGSDFGFLQTLQKGPHLIYPDSHNFVRSADVKAKGSRRYDAVHDLLKSYDTLLPRWKGVALTAEAELEASKTGREGTLPWVNIKLSSYLFQGKSPTVGADKYSEWESVGIATSEGMSHTDLAKYKYHIDLGGGGGTTWSGTIEKLAMPGLLFHHVTPTKDYIHDRLQAWKHYIPVGPDLKDLKKKYDWAESHPAQAKRIADAGTEFMRRLGTEEEFGRMYREDFVEPMRRAIEAYRPVSSVHDGGSTSWQEVLQSMGDDCRVIPVMECHGNDPNYNSCQLVDDDTVQRWATGGEYYGK